MHNTATQKLQIKACMLQMFCWMKWLFAKAAWDFHVHTPGQVVPGLELSFRLSRSFELQ